MSDLRVSSRLDGFAKKSNSAFTSESPRSLILRSSSLRLDGLDFRAAASKTQLVSGKLQAINLNKGTIIVSNLKYTKNTTQFMFSNLTLESVVDSLDSAVQQRAASLLRHCEADCDSGPDVSNGKSWSPEPRPQLHSESLSIHSQRICKEKAEAVKDDMSVFDMK